MERIPTVLSLFLLYLVIGTFRPGEKGLDILIRMIIASGVAAALYMIYSSHFLGLKFSDPDRVSIVFRETEINPNLVVFTLLLPISLLISKGIHARVRWQRVGCILALLSIGYAALLAASRGGFLAIVAIIFSYFWLKGGKKTRAVAVALVFLALIGLFASEVLFERVTFQRDTFEMARGEIWRTGLSALPDYWLLGAGLDSFPTLYKRMTYRYWGPHSIYIGTLLELGIVGLFIMVVALVYHLMGFKDQYVRDTETVFALKAALLGMLIQGASMDILCMKSFWLVLALITMLSADAPEAARQGAWRAPAWKSASIRGRTVYGPRGRQVLPFGKNFKQES
jgi:O-antigen ligase